MGKYITRVAIAGCLCVMLTACGNHAMLEEKSSVSQDQRVDAKMKDIWVGYAKEHAELIKKYPEWFDEQGKISYPFKNPYEEKGDRYHDAWKKNAMPKEIIDSLNTRQLLRATSEYPELMFFIEDGPVANASEEGSLYLGLQGGMKKMSEENRTEVCQELMARKDLIPTCYEFYKNAELGDDLMEKYDPQKEYTEEGNREVLQARTEIVLAEYVLCTEEAYEQLGTEERQTVVEAAKRMQMTVKKALKKLGGYQFSAICLDAYHFSSLARSAKPNKLSPWQDLLIEANVDIYAYPPEKILLETGIQ